MTSGQRWIAIVAFGAVCLATASTVNLWLTRRSIDGGWFNYAPNNGVAFSPSPGAPWRGLAVWLVAILIWFGVSLAILRRADRSR